MANNSYQEALNRHTREGELYEKLPDGKLRCFACGHLCPIPEGRSGVCKVRFNQGGKLYVPWGYVAGIQDDPIEKKPFFHVLPGARALSFGMLGCDFHCGYCQNWVTSQALRDNEAQSPLQAVTAEQLVKIAVQRKCQVMTSTYNEPLITSEWAVEVFKQAKRKKLITSYVSNGNATPQVLEYIRPWVDLYKIDLKGFDDRRYRDLGGTLSNVCESIRRVYDMGFWLEIVTLLIPGFNDSADEIKKLTEFVASVSAFIPWHVTAFHQDYKMSDPRNTQTDDLMRAVAIARKAGLKYIYPGNLPGQVGTGENTYCHQCGELLIERFGFQIRNDKLTPNQGMCPYCKTQIPGIWRTHEC